jgi:1,2-diacylglycerol 3-beta-galactosyltransferase
MALSTVILWLLSLTATSAFRPPPSHRPIPSTRLNAEEEVATIQILMSDTGGGHRASANALRDAFNVLHETEPMRFPLKIECDIVDIYTDYGPFWPINAYVPLYKIMAEYSFLWKWFYEFGATPLGLWMNDFLLEVFCFESFERCMKRNPLDIEREDERADMVVSVHPLCQDLPLKILASLDTNGASRKEGRVTPFATVVTDLGGGEFLLLCTHLHMCFACTQQLLCFNTNHEQMNSTPNMV